jgi:protein-L-isoaspartate O-methyltransferase
MTYPLYQIIHGTYVPSGSDFYMIQSQQSGAAWISPIGFASMITALNLQASANLAAYPNAYVVGTGTGYWSTDAAAKAAALADFNTIITARNTAAIIAAAQAALNSGQPSPYITSYGDSPVAGPG